MGRDQCQRAEPRALGRRRGALDQPRRLPAPARRGRDPRRLAREGDVEALQRRLAPREGRGLPAGVVDRVAADRGGVEADPAGAVLRPDGGAARAGPGQERAAGAAHQALAAGDRRDVAHPGVDGAPGAVDEGQARRGVARAHREEEGSGSLAVGARPAGWARAALWTGGHGARARRGDDLDRTDPRRRLAACRTLRLPDGADRTAHRRPRPRRGRRRCAPASPSACAACRAANGSRSSSRRSCRSRRARRRSPSAIRCRQYGPRLVVGEE